MMKKIKYLIMDVDGTLTDGKIYMGTDGELCKAFNIKDGCGIHEILLPAGIIPVIITGRTSEIVSNRCRELGIVEVYQGVKDKTLKINEILNRYSSKDSITYGYGDVAYIGDDLNDLPCMTVIKEAGGVIGCPLDAVEDVVKKADFVSSKKGGDGAVREFIEWLLSGQYIT